MTHSSQALYDADIGIQYSRKFCSPGTREKILTDIQEWATTSKPDNMLGYWMCGMAGTGKSTIAMSTCKILKDKGLLAGTFFCSRQILECRDYRLVIPTLAYQLARFSKTFAMSLGDILSEDPDLPTKKPDEQVKALLIKPWMKVTEGGKMGKHTPVVVIDALDECEGISLVLKPLISAIQNKELPGLKFFLTSRPEVAIQQLMDTNHADASKVKEFILHNVKESEVQQDIYTYIKSELEAISPSEEQLNRLKMLSGKLFIYASTVVKFIKDGGSQPRQKDRLSLSLQQSRDQEDLDQLYAEIIDNAIPKSRLAEEVKQDWKIIYTVISIRKPLTCNAIAELLKMDVENVTYLIKGLQAVLYISDQNNCIFTFHASFPEYIAAKKRDYESKFQHQELVLACFRTMEQLKFNICGLPSSFIPDREVLDFEKRVKKHIGETIQYCCQFWSYHFMQCEIQESVIDDLKIFLKEKGIYWIEAMSLLGQLSGCGEAMDSVIKVSAVLCPRPVDRY